MTMRFAGGWTTTARRRLESNGARFLKRDAPNFWLYIVESVRQGDPANFTLKGLSGDKLARLRQLTVRECPLNGRSPCRCGAAVGERDDCW